MLKAHTNTHNWQGHSARDACNNKYQATYTTLHVMTIYREAPPSLRRTLASRPSWMTHKSVGVADHSHTKQAQLPWPASLLDSFAKLALLPASLASITPCGGRGLTTQLLCTPTHSRHHVHEAHKVLRFPQTDEDVEYSCTAPRLHALNNSEDEKRPQKRLGYAKEQPGREARGGPSIAAVTYATPTGDLLAENLCIQATMGRLACTQHPMCITNTFAQGAVAAPA